MWFDIGIAAVHRGIAVRCLLLLAFAVLSVVELKAKDDLIPGLRVQERVQLSPRLLEYKLATLALEEPTSVRVLLPQHVEKGRRYPVLYLLHGGVGDFRDWTRAGDVERLTSDLPLIVVMPDGGPVGWYTNWFNRGAGGPPQWETYHIDQLIPWVDAEMPTLAAREGRAIAGLSMGGFGALSYAARHPDLFIAAAAFSGFVDIANPQFAPLLQGMFPLLKANAKDIFGDYSKQSIRWRARNPVDLAENLKSVTIVLRTGNGRAGADNPRLDIVEFAVHATMKSLQARLEELQIEHVWEDYGPAGHNYVHWKRSLEKTLPIFMETFAKPAARPEAISFVSADPEFSVFGWHIKQLGSDATFITLKNAKRDGFELLGAGNAVVTTPAATFPPHAEVVATLRIADLPPTTQTLTADPMGRVVVQVSLKTNQEPSQSTPAVVVSFESMSPEPTALKVGSAEDKR